MSGGMTDRAAQLLGIADAVYAGVEGPEPGHDEQSDRRRLARGAGRREVRVLAGEPGIPCEEVEAETEARLRRTPRS